MKTTHSITINVFLKINEDIEAATRVIEVFLPKTTEKDKINLKKELIKIPEGENLTILKIKTTKERHNKHILNKLKDLLGEEQCETIANDDNRVDEEGNLYIRLDKTLLEEENEAKLVDHGNCYHVKIMIAAYPKTKTAAIEVIKNLFGEQK